MLEPTDMVKLAGIASWPEPFLRRSADRQSDQLSVVGINKCGRMLLSRFAKFSEGKNTYCGVDVFVVERVSHRVRQTTALTTRSRLRKKEPYPFECFHLQVGDQE